MIHIAGQPVQVGSVVRQRCSWCGALIDHFDLNRIAAYIGEANADADIEVTIPTWEVNVLIEITYGNPRVIQIVEHDDGDQLPPSCCAQIDHEITM